jgi:hypothetical protein
MVPSEWSRHVCFAGIGPGEVLDGQAKLVGVSQRRTRRHARFQCALHRRWQPELIAGLFRRPGPSAAELDRVAATIDLDVDDVIDALLVGLDRVHGREGSASEHDAGSDVTQPTSHV